MFVVVYARGVRHPGGLACRGADPLSAARGELRTLGTASRSGSVRPESRSPGWPRRGPRSRPSTTIKGWPRQAARELRLTLIDGRQAEVPLDQVTVFPATLDSTVRAFSAGRHGVDLSALETETPSRVSTAAASLTDCGAADLPTHQPGRKGLTDHAHRHP